MKLSTLITLCTASLLLLSGCMSPKPGDKDKVTVDSSLPVITLTKNGVIRDMKTIAFEWNSIQDNRVNKIYVYKRDYQDEDSKKIKYFATIDNRFKTHFLDNSNEPNKKYSYAFRVASADANGKLSKIFIVHTLPVLKSVAWIHSIAGLPRMAKIIWRPHIDGRVNRYIIERKSYDEEKWEKVATLNGRLNAEYIDKDLKDNYVYFYRIRVETYDSIISSPSKIVKVITKALPASLTNINATRNLPKKIKIVWEKSTEKDFRRYYLYRSESKDGKYKLIAKLYNNKFVDNIKKDGKSYFYRVSVIDKDGLESKSAQHTVMGMSLAKPQSPTVVEVKVLNNAVKIKWNTNDPRVSYYRVVRKSKDGWFRESIKKFDNIKSDHLVDMDVKKGKEYTYYLYDVDANGIFSDASEAIKVVVKENSIDKINTAKASSNLKKQIIKKSSKKVKEVITPVNDLDLNEM